MKNFNVTLYKIQGAAKTILLLQFSQQSFGISKRNFI